MGAAWPTKARRSVGLTVCTRDGRMSKGGGRHMGAAKPTKPQGSTAQISPQGVTRLTAVCQGAQEAARETARTNKALRRAGRLYRDGRMIVAGT